MSSFCYSITRPYPYKWFTPVAVVGGIVLAALFTFINFYSNAYNMVTITTNNPDMVEANRWLHVPGSLTNRIHPKCEDAIIPVGSTINTNQTALSYQLVSLRNHPALSYHNKRLQNCDITQILIDFETSDERQATLIDESSWGITVSADITCDAPTEGTDWAALGFRPHYNPLSWAAELGVSSFIRVNASSTGFLWANTLLLAFWTETVTAIVDQTIQPESSDMMPKFNLSSGYINLLRPGLDIKNESFFRLGKYAFFNLAESKAYRGNFSTQEDTAYEDLIKNQTWPNVWSPANRLAKAMYSVISVDLGLTDSKYMAFDGSPADMSILTTADRLHHWTENLTQIWDRSTIANKENLLPYGWMQMRQFDQNTDAADPKWPLTFTPSVISATYTCQVPRLKSTGNIFISILVADLVLLRAAWTLYNYLVDYFLKTRHPDANMCANCLIRGRDDEGKEVGRAGKEDKADVKNIELNDLGTPHRPPSHEGDQQSMQSLLTHRIVGI